MWRFVILGGVRFTDSSILHGSTFENMVWNFQNFYYTFQPRAAKCNLADVKPQQPVQLTFVFNSQFSVEELIGFDYYWGAGSTLAFAPNWKQQTLYLQQCVGARSVEGPRGMLILQVSAPRTGPESPCLCEAGPESHMWLFALL